MHPLFRWGPDSYVGSHCARFAPPLPLLCCALLFRQSTCRRMTQRQRTEPCWLPWARARWLREQERQAALVCKKAAATNIRHEVSKTNKKKRPNTFVVSVPLWTVRCGQRRKLSRLRKQSARRNQSISSKQNKRKNAADEPPFISQRATALERLGKSANSQTGFYDFRNMVGGKLRFLTIRNVLVSCNTTVTKVCLDGRGICESTASENDGGVVWKHFLHPRNENPGVFFKWFYFNKSRRKTLTCHHRDTEILQCTEMRHNLYVWTKCGRLCAHIQVFSLSLPFA